MKVAVVTGASKGLGLGFAHVLAKRGYKVYAAARKFYEFDSDLDNIDWLKLDVTDDRSIKNLAEKISDNNERVDLLVNNAGLNKDTVTDGDKDKVCKLEKLDRTSLNKMFDVNATSALILAKYFVNLMKPGGLILNISSNRGSFHDENDNSSANYGYRASKAALNMLTLALSEDLPEEIFTVAVHPGSVKTSMNPRGAKEPEDAASEILSSFIENWEQEMNGGYFRADGTGYPY